MPIAVPAGLPSIFIRKEAFERSGLARSEIDQRFNLTDAEFRVEGALVVVGVLSSVVAAFFYVRVIVLMFFSDPVGDGPAVAVPSVLTLSLIHISEPTRPY